jgi:hypothetical protein
VRERREGSGVVGEMGGVNYNGMAIAGRFLMGYLWGRGEEEGGGGREGEREGRGGKSINGAMQCEYRWSHGQVCSPRRYTYLPVLFLSL